MDRRSRTVTVEIVSATRAHGLLPDERRLVEAYGALPRAERDAFLRQIEVASLSHRRAVHDRDSGFPAAPPNAEWSELLGQRAHVQTARFGGPFPLVPVVSAPRGVADFRARPRRIAQARFIRTVKLSRHVPAP